MDDGCRVAGTQRREKQKNLFFVFSSLDFFIYFIHHPSPLEPPCHPGGDDLLGITLITADTVLTLVVGHRAGVVAELILTDLAAQAAVRVRATSLLNHHLDGIGLATGTGAAELAAVEGGTDIIHAKVLGVEVHPAGAHIAAGPVAGLAVEADTTGEAFE
jgi:hypothetical protein